MLARILLLFAEKNWGEGELKEGEKTRFPGRNADVRQREICNNNTPVFVRLSANEKCSSNDELIVPIVRFPRFGRPYRFSETRVRNLQ